MKWLVLSYTMPTKMTTASRVRIWRKLRKSGAISPKAGVHILPYTEECLETVRWLMTEIEQEQGEALLMNVQHFENLPDDKIIDIFRKERSADYVEIENYLNELEKKIKENSLNKTENGTAFKRDINKLKKNVETVSRIDFFKIYDKKALLDRLHQLQRSLVTSNLILLILFSLGTLNTVVLRKMKEERYEVTRKESIKIKRTFDRSLVFP